MEKKYLISPEKFKKSKYQFFVLSGDIGATNSYFAIMGVISQKKYDVISKYTYETTSIGLLHDVLNYILKDVHDSYTIEVNRCCLGAAGPLSRKRTYIKLTNLDLEINSVELLKNTMLNKVILVNDFEALGYGLDLIDIKKDTISLNHVNDDLTSGWTFENVFGVIGAGAGLGITIVPYNHQTHLHVPMPSEGGHMDFPVHDEFDLGLVNYLKENILTKKDVHPEFERVLCGQGLANIYDYLRSLNDSDDKLLKKIDSLDGIKKLQEIESNYSKSDICKTALNKFIIYYARMSRIIALTSECYSGLFLTGRVTLNNLKLFKKGLFMDEFEKHDKRSDLLRKIPVYVINNSDLGLKGCCNVATNFYYKN